MLYHAYREDDDRVETGKQ